ncbi:MAG: PD40 domain-containing protein [Anaerolineae bacterium]|nr:PD40 domain-containing protein [Anaerolineae bacterium]
MKHLLLFVTLIVLMTGTLSAQEIGAENTDFRCKIATGDHVFPRYEEGNQRLVLVSWNTGQDVMVLEEGFSTSKFDIRGWSPDCRFLMVGLGPIGAQDIAVWNVNEGRRVGTIVNSSGYEVGPLWSPDSSYAVVQTLRGGFLWNLVTGQQHLISTGVDSTGRNFYGNRSRWETISDLTWDMARNQLLAVHIGREKGVTATDLNTGQPVAFYHVGERPGPVGYELFGSDLLVFSNAGGKFERGLALWNRNSGSSLQLDINVHQGYVRPYGFSQILYSPDGRYLAIVNRDVFIWDTTTFASSAAPYPAAMRLQMRDQSARDIRFVDAVTLDTVNYVRRGWWGSGYYTIARWNVATGEQLHYSYGGGYRCNEADFVASHPVPDLMQWTCSHFEA